MVRFIGLARAHPRLLSIVALVLCLLSSPTASLAGDCSSVTLAKQSQRLADLTLDLDHARRLTRLDPSLENTSFRVAEMQARWQTIVTSAIQCLEPDEANAIRTKAKNLQVLLRDLELAKELFTPAPPLSKEHVVEHVSPSMRGAAGNDQCAQAIPIAIGTLAGTTVGATNDGSATCGASLDSPDVWFKFTQTTSGRIAFDTKGSDFDTVVSVHTGCPGTLGAVERLCNDDALGSAAGGSIWASSGEQLWFRVAGYNGATGNYQLTLGEGGTITGTVTSDDPAWIPAGTIHAVNENGQFLRSASVAADGTYAIAGLYPGTALIKTSVSEHLNEIFDDVPCSGECPLAEATPFLIGAATVGIADFELSPGGVLRGTVLESGTNNPLVGIRMFLREPVSNALRTGFTGNDGTFSFRGLTPGRYRLLADANDHGDEYYDNIPCENGNCNRNLATLITINLVEETTGIDFLLDPLGSISGVVTDEVTGNPLEGARVDIYQPSNRLGAVFSNEEGEYSRGVPAGTYTVLFEHNGYQREVFDDIDWPGSYYGSGGTEIVVGTSQDLPNVNAALRPYPRIRGTLSSSAGPLSGYILVSNQDHGFSASTSYQDGTYDVEIREPGTYYVYARSYGYTTEIWDNVLCPEGLNQCPTTGAAQITISSSGITENIDFSLELGSTISGQISGANGEAVVGLNRLYLYREGSFWDSIRTYTSSFSFGNLPPGTYNLLLTNDFYEDQIYSGMFCAPNCDPTSGTPLILAPSQTLTADFTLVELGRISGTVIDNNGKPVTGTVIAESLNGSLTSGLIESDGTYVVRGLPAGDYYLWTSGNEYQSNVINEIWEDIPCPDNCPLSNATRVSVAEHQLQTGFDFVLATAGTIEVEITEAASGAALQAEIVLYDATGRAIASDYASNFSFRNLVAGDYFLIANTYNHARTAYDGVPCPPSQGVCDPTTIGSPVSVALGSVSTIVFSLDRLGGLSGVVSSNAGVTPTGTQVALYDEQDPTRLITAAWTAEAGTYSFSRLQPGTYYAATRFSNGFIDESYDNIPCPVSPPQGCDPTKGTPIVVLPGRETRHIDFDLRAETSVTYGVLRSIDGDPIPGSFVDVWDFLGTYAQSVPVAANGGFDLSIQDGFYYLSTDAGHGFLEEVHEDVQCPLGSAYAENCDPTSGTIVEVNSSASPTIVIFQLELSTLFSDGFETGNISAWTTPP